MNSKWNPPKNCVLALGVVSPSEGFGSLGIEGFASRSSALNTQQRKICSDEISSPARDLMPIVRFISKDLVHVPGLPSTVGNSYGLLALIGMAFEFFVEIYVSNKISVSTDVNQIHKT